MGYTVGTLELYVTCGEVGFRIAPRFSVTAPLNEPLHKAVQFLGLPFIG
jgi:hypothetical protein